MSHRVPSVATPVPWRTRPSRLRFWRGLVTQALPLAPTPFFLCSAVPLEEAVGQLRAFSSEVPIPVRHWLSCKTQPLRPLLQWWKREVGGIEVVSEFEFRAALAEGFAPEHILVNGPAKHRWLPQVAVPGIRVNFDSEGEIASLLGLARRQRWSVGVRCQLEGESGRKSDAPTQFGMNFGEAIGALRRLARERVALETVQFHYGTQIACADLYQTALEELALICRAAGVRPSHLDCGGGWPSPGTFSPDGQAHDAAFDLSALAAVYRRVLPRFPGLRELWLENGRFVSARSGALVVRVADVKVRAGARQLICDGGRTTNAMVSTWESHDLFSVPPRSGRTVLTSVHGPTCMAFDELTRRPLPAGLRIGDCLVWADAGAYHLSWETRFSHGHAAILWHENGQLRVVRPAQTFREWWS